MVNVCDIHVMKPLLAEHGFHFSKAKGQNFLIAPWVPQSIAEDAGVDETAGVLEIGPGIGPLTQQLCLRAKKVCAVELDLRLKPILQQTVRSYSGMSEEGRPCWNRVPSAYVATYTPGPDSGNPLRTSCSPELPESMKQDRHWKKTSVSRWIHH